MWTPGVVDYGTRYTQLVKTDLSKTWTIQHSVFDYSIIDRPDALMTPFKWTADGEYLYFYPRYYPGGSGFPQSAFLYTHINSLYRIKLETGEFELFLKRDQFRALAFSPNDQFLAYSEYDKPNAIHIKNMETGEDSQIEIQENVVATGAFIWHPDSTKVVFFAGYGKQSDDWQDDLSGTSIFVLTPKNMHIQKVLAKDSRIFEPFGCSDNHDVWLDNNTICLYSINHELDSWNKFFSFNIMTGAVEFLRPFP
jgi:WD40 repeat protein